MKKRIILLLLAFIVMLQSAVGATTTGQMRYGGTENNQYTPGPITYNLDLADYSFTNNGIVSTKLGENRLQLQKDGTVTYKFYLPFDAISVVINTFEQDPTSITVSMGGETVTRDLIGLTAHVLAGANPQFIVNFDKAKKMGDAELTISSTNPVLIKSVLFNKEKRASIPGAGSPMPKLTDYEEALYQSVVINSESPIIKVSNGIRYVNYENSKEIPFVEDDRMYMPLSSFARALSCYYEENVSKGWLLLRNNTSSAEIAMKDGKLYKQLNLGSYTEIENIVKQRNGKYYVPVRYFAEIMGKSVSYKDGFTVIDYRDLARKALEEPVFSQLKAEFEDYKLSSVGGRVYHVAQSENASDSNDGSEASPFLTLNKAGEVAGAGDKVIVHDGTYREIFTPKNDGTASNPIIFEAAEGEKPVISALDEVASPVGTEGDMLVYDTGIDLGDGRNMVFYNDEALAEARHPNSHTAKRQRPGVELGPLWPTQGNIVVMGENRPWYDWGPEAENYAVSDTDLDQEKDFWKGGTFVTQHGNGWVLGTAKILSSEKGRINLGNPNEETCTINWWYPTDRNDLSFGYITSTKNAVDMPGEWYAEGGKLWIIPPEGQTADTLKIKIKARQLCVDLNDRSYVQLKNISTIGGGTRMNHSKLCVLNGGTHKYISHYIFTLDQWCGYADDAMRYGDNGMPQRGEVGIYLGGTSCAVINANIRWSAGSGIYTSGTYSYIENNLIEDCSYMSSYLAGILDSWAGTDDVRTPRSGNLIVSNTINKVGRSMYSMEIAQQGWDVAEGNTPYLPTEVSYNDMKNGALASRDGGIVYIFGSTMGSDRKHHNMHHNTISDSWSRDGFTIGIYYDNYTRMADCHDNVIFSSHEETTFTDGRGIFSQTPAFYPNAYATVDIWNNMIKTYVPDGKNSLTADDFPCQKPFRTGHIRDNEEYLINYEQFNPIKTETSADSAILSNGVILENGIARFSGEKQTVTFPNVDFGNGKNALDIIFTTDYANTGDKIEVSIDGVKAYAVMSGETRDEKKYNNIRLSTNGVNGIHNVTIKTLVYKSLGIVRVTPVNDSDVTADGILGKTYFGHYDEVVRQGALPVTRKILGDGNVAHQGIMNGWGEQTVIKYDNVGVEKDATKLIVAAGSDQQWANGIISVRIGAPDAEPIGSVEVFPRSGWDVKQTMEVPLAKSLKAGVYTVYITYHKEGSCNDCWYFGFKE